MQFVELNPHLGVWALHSVGVLEELLLDAELLGVPVPVSLDEGGAPRVDVDVGHGWDIGGGRGPLQGRQVRRVGDGDNVGVLGLQNLPHVNNVRDSSFVMYGKY